MTWQNYSKDVQEKLQDNPAMKQAINKMLHDGCWSKDDIIRITGAPYDVVDATMHGRPIRVVSQEEQVRMEAPVPQPKKRLTPEQHQKMIANLAKARAARKKK